MNVARGKGQLFHKFHGRYWASIGLMFGSELEATEALRVLGEPWKQSEKNRTVLGCAVDSAALDGVKQTLGKYGAEVRAIDSLRFSVDCGEPFTVDIPILPPENRPAGWGHEFADVSGSMVQASLWGGS